MNKERGDYIIEKSIGKGGQGHVYKVFHKKDKEKNNPLALKMISCEDIKELNKALKEMTSLLQMNHRNLIQYLDVFIHDDDGYMLGLVMPFYSLGDLKKFIRYRTRKQKHLNEKMLIDFVEQIVSGVSHLHEKKIMHRDIKPENIFMVKENSGGYCLKIGDFGLATRIIDGEDHDTVCGTLNYMSPEVASSQRYNYPSDVFSLGVVCYTLFSLKSKTLYLDLLVNEENAKKNIRQDMKTDCSDELIEIVISMLNVIPKDRPKPSEILESLSQLKTTSTLSEIETITEEKDSKSLSLEKKVTQENTTALSKSTSVPLMEKKKVKVKKGKELVSSSQSSNSFFKLFTIKPVEAFEHLIQFDAPIDVCIDVIQDFESYPFFVNSMNSAKILEKEGNSSVVEYSINAGITTITYVLAQEYEKETNKLKWNFVSGPFEKNSGYWQLTSINNNQTYAKYSITFGLSKFIPHSLTKYFLGQPLLENIACFKKKIDSQHQLETKRSNSLQ
eukprot:gene9822-2144_t